MPTLSDIGFVETGIKNSTPTINKKLQSHVIETKMRSIVFSHLFLFFFLCGQIPRNESN